MRCLLWLTHYTNFWFFIDDIYQWKSDVWIEFFRENKSLIAILFILQILILLQWLLKFIYLTNWKKIIESPFNGIFLFMEFSSKRNCRCFGPSLSSLRKKSFEFWPIHHIYFVNNFPDWWRTEKCKKKINTFLWKFAHFTDHQIFYNDSSKMKSDRNTLNCLCH